MRSYKPLIVYMAAVMFLTLAYFASPISRGAVWQVFPGLETMAHAHPLGSAFGGLSAFLFYRKHIQRPSAPLNQQSAVKVWLTLLGLRLSPLVPAPLVNFIAAIFDVSPLQYLTTSMLGGAPLVLFYAQIGQQGHHLLSGETPHWQQC